MDNKNYYGGFWLRLCALIMDSALMFLVSGVVNVALGLKFFATSANPNPKEILAVLITFSIQFLYFSLGQALMNGTLGKRALGLVLLDAKDFEQISIGQAFGRSFMQFISFISFCLGYIWIGFHQKKQGWHDSVAGTIVVKKKYLEKVKLEAGIFPKKSREVSQAA